MENISVCQALGQGREVWRALGPWNGSTFYFIITVAVFTFRLCPAAFGTLVSQPGVEPVPPAVEAHSLDPWTTRKSPVQYFDGSSSSLT